MLHSESCSSPKENTHVVEIKENKFSDFYSLIILFMNSSCYTPRAVLLRKKIRMWSKLKRTVSKGLGYGVAEEKREDIFIFILPCLWWQVMAEIDGNLSCWLQLFSYSAMIAIYFNSKTIYTLCLVYDESRIFASASFMLLRLP